MSRFSYTKISTEQQIIYIVKQIYSIARIVLVLHSFVVSNMEVSLVFINRGIDYKLTMHACIIYAYVSVSFYNLMKQWETMNWISYSNMFKS